MPIKSITTHLRPTAALVAALAVSGAVAGAGVAGAEAAGCDLPRPTVRSTELVTSGFRYLPGGDDCGIPRLAVERGRRLAYRNLDFAAHDVRSFALRPGTEEPLFTSDLIRYLGGGEVVGVAALPPGSYGFYCTIHPPRQSGTGMRGTLVVQETSR